MRIGEFTLLSITDGTFIADPEYFGPQNTADGHEELFAHQGKAFLPIGAFLITVNGQLILVDAGLGPMAKTDDHRCRLIGGQLLTGLRAAGFGPSDIDIVLCTHLHSDHVGWLFAADESLTFPNAKIYFGGAEWDHFIMRDEPTIQPHVRAGFLVHRDSGRLYSMGEDKIVAPGVTAVQTPGHTPGHLCVVVASGRERALLLGDAITCPVQLDEPTWHSMGDVDPDLADRTRERLWRELEGEDVTGAGAHFPELKFGRVLTGQGRRWWT